MGFDSSGGGGGGPPVYGNPYAPVMRPTPGFNSQAPTMPPSGGAPGAPGGGAWWQNPVNLGLIMAGGGSLLNAYTQNKNANKNMAAVQQRQQQIDRTAGALAWTDPMMNQSALESIISGASGNGVPGNTGQLDLKSLFGMNPLGNTSTDGIMQMLRGSGPASIAGDLLTSGNPFDTSQMFDALGIVDARNTGEQVAGLRAGAAGLGQRFGGTMMREEGNLRSRISQDINARNAGIQMQSFESAQGRRMGTLDQLLRSAGMNLDSSRQNQSMQLAAISQMFNQALGQRQFNQGLLSLQAGLPIAQNGAPGYGQAFSDIGQLIAFAPMLSRRD